MAALDFPTNPSNNDTHTVGDVTWTYNATKGYWLAETAAITGFTGSLGFVGSLGFTGSQGDQGTTGFTGSQGDQGTTGFVGSQGDTGTTGFTGSKGDGFLGVPENGEKTTSYTLQTSDNGKCVTVGSGGSITIPNSTFSGDEVVTIWNNTTGDVTITCSITTAYISGTNTNKASVTLATRGICSIWFSSGTVCVISGSVS